VLHPKPGERSFTGQRCIRKTSDSQATGGRPLVYLDTQLHRKTTPGDRSDQPTTEDYSNIHRVCIPEPEIDSSV
jgi:hypothetical protein